jgi:hypothetical protein
VNGISNVVKEHKITDLIIGLHEKKGITDSFLGFLTEGVLTRCNTTTMIYKPYQPMATIKRHIIIVPDKAEKEYGFFIWLVRIWNIGINTGAKLVFYASAETMAFLKQMQEQHAIEAGFIIFSDWDEILVLSKSIRKNDNLVVVMSRRMHPSYRDYMAKIPSYLNKFSKKNSFILVYPMQLGVSEYDVANMRNPSMMEPFLKPVERLDEFRKLLTKFFRKNNPS